jgi:hypothetical protein
MIKRVDMCCNATNLIKSQFILRKNGKIVSSNYHLNTLKKKERKKEREKEPSVMKKRVLVIF